MLCRRTALGVSLFLLSSGCSENAWVRVSRELRGFQRQANAAIDLATDPRTKALFGLCADSALRGIQKSDDYLKVAERLRQAKKQGVTIPELERAVAIAIAEAEDAEATARKDCARAGVSKGLAPAAVDAGPADGAHPADMATPHDGAVVG